MNENQRGGDTIIILCKMTDLAIKINVCFSDLSPMHDKTAFPSEENVNERIILQFQHAHCIRMINILGVILSTNENYKTQGYRDILIKSLFNRYFISYDK